MSMTKPTSEQVTHLEPATNAVMRTAMAKMGDFVTVKDFGAIGNDSANDTAAVQAAIDFAIANKKPLYISAGVYRIHQSLSWNGPLVMIGPGRTGVSSSTPGIAVFRAVAPMRAILQGAQTWPSGVNATSHIAGISLIGMTNAQYGIETVTDHSIIRDLQISTCSTAGVRIGGICNTLTDIAVRYCGNGFEVFPVCGQTVMTNCKAMLNGNIGIHLQGGGGDITINGGICEDNRQCGILVSGNFTPVNIRDFYFEGNGADGHTFTSPTTLTVKCDIIFNGSSTNIYSLGQAPNDELSVVSITGCFSTANLDGFVFANGIISGVIENNHCPHRVDPQVLPVCLFYGSHTVASRLNYGSPRNLRIERNNNFSPTVVCSPFANTSIFVADPKPLSDTYIDTSAQQNIAETDFSRWSLVNSGTGSFVRSSEKFPFNAKVPVWEVQYLAGPSSTGVFGFNINAADIPQYHGKLMLFGAWIKSVFTSAPESGLVSLDTISQTETQQRNYLPLGWIRKLNFFIMPTTGTLKFGLIARADSGASAGACQIAAPVLCEFGAKYEALWGEYGAQTVFYGTAAPIAGTWLRGDVMWNTTPSAGGDPGWMCVTGGTPGTWKAMANLDA